MRWFISTVGLIFLSLAGNAQGDVKERIVQSLIMPEPGSPFFLASNINQAPAPTRKGPVETDFQVKAKEMPFPILRYDLQIKREDRKGGNAAIGYYRAALLYADRTPEGRKADVQIETELQNIKELKDIPKEKIREYLKTKASILKELTHATNNPKCDWEMLERLDQDGFTFLLPEVQQMRTLAKLLSWRSKLNLLDGKIEESLEDVQRGFTMARHVADGPTLIQNLVGIAIANIFSQQIEELIQNPNCPNLYWALSTLPKPFIDFQKSVEGETRMVNSTFPSLKELDGGPLPVAKINSIFDKFLKDTQLYGDRQPVEQMRIFIAGMVTISYPNSKNRLLALGRTEANLDAMPQSQVVLLDAVLRFRGYWDETFAALNLPYPQAIQILERANNNLNEIRKGQTNDIFAGILTQFVPAIERAYAANYRIERKIACLRTMEAIRAYASTHEGKLPAKLSDIDQYAVPNDPATGKPFEYEVNGNRYSITAPPLKGDASSPQNSWKYNVTVTK